MIFVQRSRPKILSSLSGSRGKKEIENKHKQAFIYLLYMLQIGATNCF
jgi:hypothetical protein